MNYPVFPDQDDPDEKPTDYIANPVRVQLPKYDARAEGRRWTQMDLIALANNILARENECTELRKMVRELSIRFSGLQTQVEALNAVVTRSGPANRRLTQALEAFAEVMNEDDEDDSEF
jgi:hypothetical protein